MTNQSTHSEFYHALTIDSNMCTGCTNCMRVCPTEAIRIRQGKAVLNKNKCIDCGECCRVCPVKAIYIKHDDFSEIFKYRYRIALVPAVFIGQFSQQIRVSEIYACMKELGFTHIYEVEHGVGLVTEAYRNYMEQQAPKTYISPFCPAIVRLIQVRFPSLIPNIIHIKVPLDFAAYTIIARLCAAGIKREEIGVFYLTPCAAKIASVKSPVEGEKSEIAGVINMDIMYNKVRQILINKPAAVDPINHTLRGIDVLYGLSGGEAMHYEGRCFAIDGMKNVIEFLEQLENDKIQDVDFIELRACDQSCAGGVLTSANRFLAIERLKNRAKHIDALNKTRSLPSPCVNKQFLESLSSNINIPEIKPRNMLPIGNNMQESMALLEQMKQLEASLPGVHCGLCGAPTCHAFAEDVVLGMAETNYCVFNIRQDPKTMAADSEIWGIDKYFEL